MRGIERACERYGEAVAAAALLRREALQQLALIVAEMQAGAGVATVLRRRLGEIVKGAVAFRREPFERILTRRLKPPVTMCGCSGCFSTTTT